ncbi:hypothetical protein GVAV_000065 [Gurleya vavrai]
MHEIAILEQIFNDNIYINESNINITTRHGQIRFKLHDDYPRSVPDISLIFSDRSKEADILDKIKNKNDDFVNKNMIYPLVYNILKIFEDREEINFEVHLTEVNEITQEIFDDWRNSRRITNKTEDSMTGKAFFQDLMQKDRRRVFDDED